jgi:hypothetical protein
MQFNSISVTIGYNIILFMQFHIQLKIKIPVSSRKIRHRICLLSYYILKIKKLISCFVAHYQTGKNCDQRNRDEIGVNRFITFTPEIHINRMQ